MPTQRLLLCPHQARMVWSGWAVVVLVARARAWYTTSSLPPCTYTEDTDTWTTDTEGAIIGSLGEVSL